MSNLEGMVCPWAGCGGTIQGTSTGLEHGNGWICSMCGELFASPEDYQAKLRKENEWAEAWIKWSDEKKHEDMDTEQEGTETFPLEHDIEDVGVEEVGVEEKIEQAVAE